VRFRQRFWRVASRATVAISPYFAVMNLGIAEPGRIASTRTHEVANVLNAMEDII
jgi:hypothetical protein